MNIPTWEEIIASKEYKSLSDKEKKKVREKWEEDYQKEMANLLPTVEEFKSSTGLPTWREIVASSEYKALTPEQKEEVKKKYEQDSGFEPEHQVFKSDGGILTELIKGIFESSATAELFEPEAETIPATTAGRIARNVGSVIGDIPMFVAGGAIGGLSGNPEVATVTSFVTPTILKQIYRAKNVGAITAMPKLYAKSTREIDMETSIPLFIHTPGSGFMQQSPIAQNEPIITYMDKKDPNAQKLVELITQGAKETGVSAVTGLAMAGASRFLKGVATGNKIVDAALKNADKYSKPTEIDVLQNIVKTAKNVNPEAVYAKKFTDRIVKSLESGNIHIAHENLTVLSNLSKRMKIIEDVVVPSTVLTGVPSALHGEMPTVEDVATAVTLTGVMPIAMKKPAEMAMKAIGVGREVQYEKVLKGLEEYKASIIAEKVKAQKAALPEFEKTGTYIMQTVKNAEPKVVKAFAMKYLEEKLEPFRKQLEVLKEEHANEVRAIIESNQYKNENYIYKKRDIIPRSEYEALSPEKRIYRLPATEKLELLEQKIDSLRRKIYKERKLKPEDMEKIGQAIEKHVYNQEKVAVVTGKDKQLARFIAENGFFETPIEVIKEKIKQMDAKDIPVRLRKGITEKLEAEIKAIQATKNEAPANVLEAGPEILRKLHGDKNAKRYISFDKREGVERIRKKVPVYYVTRGAKFIQNYQFVYTDASVARKAEPNGVIRMALVKPRDLYHTGLSGIMSFIPSEATIKSYHKKQIPLYEDMPYAAAEMKKMAEYMDNIKQYGLKTEKLSKTFFGADKGILSIDISTKYDKTPRIIQSFANETLELTKEGKNPNVVAPITADFMLNMIQTLKTFKYTEDAAIHGKLKQGVFFYEELGTWGRNLRDTLIEAETNGMRLAGALKKNLNVFKGLSKESREAITYAITASDPRYAEFYKRIGQEQGYIVKRDMGFKALESGNPMSILTPEELIVAKQVQKFYKDMLDMINTAREAVGRDPIKAWGEGTYQPLSAQHGLPVREFLKYLRNATKEEKKATDKDVGLSMMLQTMITNGENIIGKSAEEIVRHIEDQIRFERKPVDVTFHNLKPRVMGLPKPEMDAAVLMNKYINDASRYISLQPITVYVADALTVDSINGVNINLKSLSPGAVYVYNRMMQDLGFLQMGHRFAENQNSIIGNRRVRDFFAWVQNNVAASIIAFNTNVVVNQIAAIRNTITAFGPKATYELARNLMGLVRFNDVKRLIQESDVLYARYNEPFRELYEGVGRLKKNVQDAGIFLTKLVDTSLATATYKLAKERYLKENPHDVKGAIQYASEMVARTQASTLMTDRAPIQRGIIGIYITTFANAALADYNYLVHNVFGYRRGYDKKDVVLALANYLLATSIMNTVYEEVLGMESMYPAPISRYVDLTNRGYSEDVIYMMVMSEFFKAYPLGQGSRMGGSSLGPIVTAIDTILRAGTDPRAVDKAMYYSAMLAVPAVTKMPAYGAAQMRRMWKAYSNEAEPIDYFVVRKEQVR